MISNSQWMMRGKNKCDWLKSIDTWNRSEISIGLPHRIGH